MIQLPYGLEGLKIPFVLLTCLIIGPCVLFTLQFQPGLSRFILISPLVMLHLSMPLLFSCDFEVCERASALFLLSWLANFKLMGLCINRGPLVSGQWTPLQSLVVLYLPIYPCPPLSDQSQKKKAGRLHDTSGNSMSLVIQWIFKVTLLAIIVVLLARGNLNIFVKEILQAFAIYSFLGFLMDGPAALVLGYLGVKIIPTFDQPWLSSSLSDFWGRRWNITTSHMLRALIYDPITEGRLIKNETKQSRGPSVRPSRREAGLLATFLFSGLIHELIFWCLQPSGLVCFQWFAFFSIQGPLMMIEWKLSHCGWRPGTLVSRIVTLALLFFLAHHWFWPCATTSSDLADRVVREIMAVLPDLTLYIR